MLLRNVQYKLEVTNILPMRSDGRMLNSLTSFVDGENRLKARDISFSIVFHYYCVVQSSYS